MVAPRTSTPVSSFPTPLIWPSTSLPIRHQTQQDEGKLTCTKNSVFIRLLASDSPSPLVPVNESISSMKMMDGFCSRAIWNSCLTSLISAQFYVDGAEGETRADGSRIPFRVIPTPSLDPALNLNADSIQTSPDTLKRSKPWSHILVGAKPSLPLLIPQIDPDQSQDSPFRLPHPLTDQVTTTNTEECTLRLRRHRLSKETLPCTRRPI